jgi:hypothetical protein
MARQNYRARQPAVRRRVTERAACSVIEEACTEQRWTVSQTFQSLGFPRSTSISFATGFKQLVDDPRRVINGRPPSVITRHVPASTGSVLAQSDEPILISTSRPDPVTKRHSVTAPQLHVLVSLPSPRCCIQVSLELDASRDGLPTRRTRSTSESRRAVPPRKSRPAVGPPHPGIRSHTE